MMCKTYYIEAKFRKFTIALGWKMREKETAGFQSNSLGNESEAYEISLLFVRPLITLNDLVNL
jgi:hypothetical protein